MEHLPTVLEVPATVLAVAAEVLPPTLEACQSVLWMFQAAVVVLAVAALAARVSQADALLFSHHLHPLSPPQLRAQVHEAQVHHPDTSIPMHQISHQVASMGAVLQYLDLEQVPATAIKHHLI